MTVTQVTENPFEVVIPESMEHVPSIINDLFGTFLEGRKYVLDGVEYGELPSYATEGVILKVSKKAVEAIEALNLIQYMGNLLLSVSDVLNESTILIADARKPEAAVVIEELSDFTSLRVPLQILHQALEQELSPSQSE